RNDSSVPTKGSESGKNTLLKTSAAAEPYRKKSYHSMVVPTRLAATMRLRLAGVGGADAAEAMCATSSCAVGTGTCSHTVGMGRSWAHVVELHTSGPRYACNRHACRPGR